MQLSEHIDCFFEEYAQTLQLASRAMETKDLAPLYDTVTLEGVSEGGNFINRNGDFHLNEAAALLLKQEELASKVEHESARRALIKAFFAHLPEVRQRALFRETSVIAKARDLLRAVPRHNGTYVFPVVFAPRAVASQFRIGPARIVAKAVFEKEQLPMLGAERGCPEDTLKRTLFREWEEHMAAYDHIITVEIDGFEEKKAWETGREVADFLLNLVRMLFHFGVTRNIRLDSGYMQLTTRSSLHITRSGEPWFTSHRGPWGAVLLDDGWTKQFEDGLAPFGETLVSYAAWLTSGKDRDRPVLERLRYANHLLTEAYSEPHEPIRLVRLISAIETLSLSDRTEKSHGVAWHCACAGGWGDTKRGSEIYDAIRNAYHWRNKVVHGDAPDIESVRIAFSRIEIFMLDIYLGYLSLLAKINSLVKPQSVGTLRREMARRIDLFFWNRDLAG